MVLLLVRKSILRSARFHVLKYRTEERSFHSPATKMNANSVYIMVVATSTVTVNESISQSIENSTTTNLITD